MNLSGDRRARKPSRARPAVRHLLCLRQQYLGRDADFPARRGQEGAQRWFVGRLGGVATRRYPRLVRGEWFEWEWDETLFAGAAAYYERGRLPNARGLADAFEPAFGLAGEAVFLMWAVGRARSRFRLPAFYRRLLVDADAGMIREARRLASERGVMNGRLVQGRAEELPADLGTFNVVTFAASFHWMDRPLVAGVVRGMLEPGGAVVHVDNRHQAGLSGGARRAPPVERIAELRRTYLGRTVELGRGIRNSWPGDEAAVFRGAGFIGPELVVVPDGRTVVRSADDLVAETFSLSSTAPHLFGDRLSQFEAELRRLLAEVSPDGTSGSSARQRAQDLGVRGT